MDKDNLYKLYGPPCNSDNSFAAKARFFQSWQRKHVLNQNMYGFGPDQNSKIKYGNILLGGEITGSNFLLPIIFSYAQYRLHFIKKGETLSGYRLFNNMLSSQPMCFNLFYPLKALFERDSILAANILSNCLPSLRIDKIIQVEIEYLPYPVCDYLNDRTAFDAMLIYSTKTGERNILAIETKYVEKLGNNSSSDLTKQKEIVEKSLMFNQIGKRQVEYGFGQLGRNFLLAEKFRIVNRLDKAYSVVISPSENDSSFKEIVDFQTMINHEYHDRIFYLPLESFLELLKQNVPKSLMSWVVDFAKRYLGFADCELVFKEYQKQ